jgi:D-alanine-D-alanine ligase
LQEVISVVSSENYVVIGNKDGSESSYSITSVEDARRVLGARTVMLDSNRWVRQIKALPSSSIFFLATHGGYAEDGTLQRQLESLGLRHTHSPAVAAELMSNKHHTKLRYLTLGIPTPAWRWRGDTFGDTSSKVSQWLLKPLAGGGKHGLSLAATPDASPTVIAEKFVAGEHEISVWVTGSSQVRVLPPLLRLRRKSQLGLLQDLDEEPPGDLAAACASVALRFHSNIGARGITKTDLVIDGCGRPWALETDAHPALGKLHGAARQAARAGMTYSELIKTIGSDYV